MEALESKTELFTMSVKELSRLDYIRMFFEKRLSQEEISEKLGISIRQVQRLVKAYRDNNYKGLISKKRGKVSNNKISAKLKGEVLELLINNYHDFGPTFATEKLVEQHGYTISAETVRKWMIEHNLWLTRNQKLKRSYQPRYRRNCLGELVQIDGSIHRWFEDRGPKCTLLVYIDDATSKLMELKFVESESMQTYFIATKSYINKHGRPLAFYSDQLSVFRNHGCKGQEILKSTQFGRALREVDIQLICANSSQAKGRVERANKTLQDRLIKEMRLRNISTVEAANIYAEEFIKDFNKRFGKVPISKEDKHRPLATHMVLDKIFCYKTERTVSKNLTFQHNRQLFLLEDNQQTRMLRRKKVELCEYPDGSIKIFYQENELKHRILYDRVEPEAANNVAQGQVVLDNKYLSEVLEYAKKRKEELPKIKRSDNAPRRTHLKYMTA